MATRKTKEQVAAEAAGAFEQIPSENWAVQIPGTGGAVEADEPLTADELEELAIVDRVRAMQNASPNEALTIKVFRANVSKFGRMEFCQDYAPDDFALADLSGIRNVWGPGDYEIRVIGSGGIKTRSKVSIAPLPAGAVVSQQSELAQMMSVMMAQQTKLLETLAQRPAPPDPHAQMMQTLSMMGAMRDAMGFAASGAQAPAAAVSSPATQLREMLSAMRELKNAAKELNGDESDNEPSLMQLGTQIAGIVAGAIGTRTLQGMSPTIGAPLQPLQLPASLQSVSTPSDQTSIEPENMQVIAMRGALHALCEMSISGAEPSRGAEYLTEHIPDSLFDELLPYLRLPNWFEMLRSVYPEASTHETWLRAVHAETIARADADNEIEDDSPPSFDLAS